MRIDFINHTSYPLSEHKIELRKFVKKALKHFLPHAKTIYLSIFIVGEHEIVRLNQKYRKKPCSGTVLSFPQDEPLKKRSQSERIVLGDIFLCPENIKQTQKPLLFYLWHGLLHLLGLTHKEMEKYTDVWEKMEKSLL